MSELCSVRGLSIILTVAVKLEVFMFMILIKELAESILSRARVGLKNSARDTLVTHQFKAICYLNAAGEQNGPFQYITGRYSKGNVIRYFFNKVFKPGQYRFTEDEIFNYLSENNKAVYSVTGKAGRLVYA